MSRGTKLSQIELEQLQNDIEVTVDEMISELESEEPTRQMKKKVTSLIRTFRAIKGSLSDGIEKFWKLSDEIDEVI